MPRADELRRKARMFAAQAQTARTKDVRDGLQELADAFDALARQDEEGAFAGNKPFSPESASKREQEISEAEDDGPR